MTTTPSFVETAPGTDSAETSESREGGRRRRRGRGGRDRDESRQGEPSAPEAIGEPAVEAQNGTRVDADVEAMAVNADGSQNEGEISQGDGGERESRRRGRGGRDRPRRERRDEAAPSGVEAVSLAAVVELPSAAGISIDTTTPAFAMTPADGSVQERPSESPAEAHVVSPPLVAEAEIATVRAFVLPTDELQAVAESAGLQWVNSDAEKIRAVQDAMANEPKPVHVPREPKPIVAIDEGPLVLVETRKDLAQVKLPFETQPGA
jgi:ribonuclease E